MRARAVVIDGYDGLAGLRVDEVEVAEPGPAEVRVAVAAAGIGPWDVFTADGAFAELLDDAELAATFPMVLGWDLAGVIEEAGPDPRDRRGVLVRLTPQGLELVNQAVEQHVANEERLLAALTRKDREQLARLLRKLGESIHTAEAAPAPAPASSLTASSSK